MENFIGSDGLHYLNDSIYSKPDYYKKLDDWAVVDPEDTVRRQKLVREHHGLIREVTKKMVL